MNARVYAVQTITGPFEFEELATEQKNREYTESVASNAKKIGTYQGHAINAKL